MRISYSTKYMFNMVPTNNAFRNNKKIKQIHLHTKARPRYLAR